MTPQACLLAVVALLGPMGVAPGRAAATHPAGADGTRPAPLRVVVFNSRTCARGCREVDERLPHIAARWDERIALETHYLGPERPESWALFALYDEHYNAEANTTPVLYVGRTVLKGSDAILSDAARCIAAALAAGETTYRPTPAERRRLPAADGGTDPLDRLSVGGIVAAGLIDGVNPCAFTTIIFLLSMMAYLGKGRREVAAVGVGFTVAVFVTYFLLGLGLLHAVKVFSVTHGVATGLTYAVGVLALVLAAWSFADFVRYARSGDTGDVTLRLPRAVRQRIQRVIRGGLRTRHLALGAMVVGCTVAILESLCTGQVLLPTVMLLVRTPRLRAHGVAYLLLYTVMFILPLVAILAAGCAGVSSARLGAFLRRHLGAVKLLLALLFAGLGALVLLTV
ncbi:MAG: hypothetical protein KGY99_10435 [Phycisphaerae bacterium]|nr:hypothetical protein [Phycisphaerae bacterium]